MFDIIWKRALRNAFQYVLFVKTLFLEKKKKKDIYKYMLACTCQGGRNSEMKLCKNKKMRSKAVEDKEKTEI